VHVHSVENDPIKLLHPLLISRTLSRIAYSDIKEIRKIGKGKVLAEMTTAKAANDLTNNPKLEQEGLKVFVPTYRTIRTGIVKDIPQLMDDADLLKFFDAPCKVVEVRRLNRRIRINGKVKYVPSRTVCLKFAGQLLPKNISSFETIMRFIPLSPKFRLVFLVLGLATSCKGKSRCLFCGSDAHDSNVLCVNKNNAPCCINCQGDHFATSHTCPVISKHKLVLSLAATENIPTIEAKRKIHQITPTSSSPSQYSLDFRNFPLLEKPKPRNKHSTSFVDQFYNNSQIQNRFSPLSSFNLPEDNGNISALNLPTQILSRPKKLSSSRSDTPAKQNNFNKHNNNHNSSNNGNDAPGHPMRPVGSPFENALCYSNGRPINMSGNGVGRLRRRPYEWGRLFFTKYSSTLRSA